MKSLEFIYDVPMTIRVIYSEKTMPIRDYLELKEGQAITLDKLAGEPLDFFVNDRLLARGEIVVNNEKYAIRLTEIIGKDNKKQILSDLIEKADEAKESTSTKSKEVVPHSAESSKHRAL
jgi:flagellar motor switch protein FliN/FliY